MKSTAIDNRTAAVTPPELQAAPSSDAQADVFAAPNRSRTAAARCGKPDLLVFADDWGRHPSSCQHLIKRLRENYRVLWANSVGTRQVKANGFTFRRGVEKLKSWNRGVVQVDRQMWVVDLPMLPSMGSRTIQHVNRRLVTWRLARIMRQLQFDPPVVLTNLPYILGLIRRLPRSGLVYYCTDDFSHWPGADREALQTAEGETVAAADRILAVSDPLLGRFGGAENPKCRYFPHGVDLAQFAAVANTPPTPAMAKLPGPCIGFFGLIYEKLNFELLAAIARRFSTGSLALVGPEVFCPVWFREIPNVHFLGPQPYAELPGWLAGMDVLLMPYVNDEMIRQSDPLKLRECLASGKPTVSIDIPEVRRYLPAVRVGGTIEEFVAQVELALAEKDNLPAAQARRNAVANDGWDRRTSDLAGWLDELHSSATSK
ncbi:MAG TPA: glycosyltransferase [Pirellulales bacterium]|jgi:glycosyltransferase involved in cell wall biosynthesis